MGRMADVSVIIFQTTVKGQWQLSRGWIPCNSVGLFRLNGWRRHLTSILASTLCLRIFKKTRVCLIIIRLFCWTIDIYSNWLFIWRLYFLSSSYGSCSGTKHTTRRGESFFHNCFLSLTKCRSDWGSNPFLWNIFKSWFHEFLFCCLSKLSLVFPNVEYLSPFKKMLSLPAVSWLFQPSVVCSNCQRSVPVVLNWW